MRVLLAVALLAVPAVAVAQSDNAAVVPVRLLDDGLIAIMKSGKAAGVAGRAAQIGPVVDRAFDLPLMTQLVIGPGWSSIAAPDQAALVAAFRRMTISQYARNFDGYSGEVFAIAPQVAERAGDRLVRTSIAGAGAPVSISYRLRQTNGQWRIIDVFYKNSISQLATRRADFAGVLASGGPKALIGHLDRLAQKAGD